MLTEPTSTQRQAFQLIGTAIPLTLTLPERHPANPVKAQVRPETSCRIGRELPGRLGSIVSAIAVKMQGCHPTCAMPGHSERPNGQRSALWSNMDTDTKTIMPEPDDFQSAPWDNRAAAKCSNRTARQRPNMTGINL